MSNLVNLNHVSITFGTRILLDDLTLGLASGDVIGVVGRNGDGKSTLLRILTCQLDPDAGTVIHNGRVSIGLLAQTDEWAPHASVRDVVVGGEPDHVWAADPEKRSVVADLLGDLGMDTPVDRLSGGERRRVALVALMLAGHDLLVLDEPTNHLDVEAVAWLAEHLTRLQRRGVAMLVVSHDRWFLDAICTRVWEVHDATVDAYDGGYAAYVLARAERQRAAAVMETKRQNLVRKELAWLRRGAPARTSKPRFRIDAANALIHDVPDPRDKLELQKFATARLGKDVFDVEHVTAKAGARVLLQDLTWSIGPGDRVGIVGVNGSGKTTLLRLLTGDREPESGRVKRGVTLRIGHLSQTVKELPDNERVLESVERLKRETKLATGKEASASSLLGDFGFTGDRLTARIGDLSGGERRRLQFLRLLLSEPNVLLLDEPTNDLDIDTLTVIEDYLDSWPGTLLVVSHDRYFLERVCDYTYALMGDGRCVLLPGGVDQYLEYRRNQRGTTVSMTTTASSTGDAARIRQARKDLARVEGQLEKLDRRINQIHTEMAAAATDYEKLGVLAEQLRAAETEQAEREAEWLELAEIAGN